MATITTISFESLRKILGHDEPERDFIVQQFDIKNAPYLEPCRIEAYFIAFLQKGELLVESDLVSYQLKAPAVFVMAPSVLRKFVHASGNFKSQVVFFKKSFFLDNLSDANYLDRYAFFYNRGNHYFNLNTEQTETILQYFEIIKKQAGKDNAYSNHIIRNLVQIILWEIAAANTAAKPSISFSHKQVIVSAFKSNLEAHFKTARKVSFYASLQNLTSKYFSESIRQQTGKTAGELIDERVILEAKAILQNKDLTITQAADILGFADPSGFGKYFRNLTGHSPLQYRKEIFG